VGASSDNERHRIGDPQNQGAFFAAGIRAVFTGRNDAIPVLIDSNGQLGTSNSSRDSRKISRTWATPAVESFVCAQSCQKSFDDGSKPIQYGLIAEEVADVFPDLVARSGDGQIETVKYQMLDSLLLNEVQRQEAKIRALKARLAQLDQIISDRIAFHELDR
jgi:hypothetical protein